MASSIGLSGLLKKIVAEKITLNEEERKQDVEIVNHIVSELVSCMMEEDLLFEKLYQEIVFTGSYYEGLRIENSHEFDLNLVLRLPFKPEDITIKHYPDPPDVVQFYVKEPINHLLGHWPMAAKQKLQSFFENGCLDRKKVVNWMCSITSKAAKRLIRPINVAKIQPGQSALQIIKNNREKIDIDLVPVIDGSNVLPLLTLEDVPFPLSFTKPTRFKNLISEARVFHLVPKKTQIGNSKRISRNSKAHLTIKNSTLWRVSFPLAEKQLIHDMGAVKLLIKLFKLLRDRNWPFIKSYQIKTMFIWEIEKHPNPTYWQEANLEVRFMEMLAVMKEIYSSKHMPYYFSRQTNLLSGLKITTCQNVVGRLNRMIRGLHNNRQKIYEYMYPKHRIPYLGIPNSQTTRNVNLKFLPLGKLCKKKKYIYLYKN